MCFIKHSRCVHNTAHISYIQPILITLVWWFWNSIAKPHGLHAPKCFEKRKNYQLQIASLSIFLPNLLSWVSFISRDALAGWTWLICRALDCTRSRCVDFAAHALRVDVASLCVVGFAWMWYRIQRYAAYICMIFAYLSYMIIYVWYYIQYLLVYMYVYISHHI